VTATDVTVVHPLTGELLERLDQQPPETLADAYAHIHQRRTQLKNMEQALETELRRRLDLRGRTTVTFGEWEVAAKPRNEAAWDADELERTLRDLVDDGVVQAGELTGIIRREPQISRTDVNRLITRLSAVNRAAVERCRVWQRKRGPVTVTQSAALIPEEATEQ
jgi:hypothetical protein